MNANRPPWHADAVHFRTGCKLNLFLNICSLREDGYHELQTLFYPLAEPFDEIYLRPAGAPGLSLVCPAFPALQAEKTTLHKALAAFQQALGPGKSLEKEGGYELFLHKQVPAGAGLGGGSANAAGFLRYLNDNAGEAGLSREELIKVAAKVGADVPFFLMDGPALAEGIGERLTPVQVSLAGLYLVLVCPGIHVSTPWAYGEWDRRLAAGELKASLLQEYFYQTLTGSRQNAKVALWPWFYNNLEQAVFPARPEIAAIKDGLLKCGARAALMSGSGSSVFGIFSDRESALRVGSCKAFSGYRVLCQPLAI